MYFKNNILLIHTLCICLIIISQLFAPILSDEWIFHKDYNFLKLDRPLSSIFVIYIHKFIDYEKLIDGFKIIKIFYLIILFFICQRFFNLIVNKPYAVFISFFLIFYCLHDSSVYQIWFIVHFVCAIIPFLIFYLFIKNYKKLGYIIFLLIPFLSYTSIPSQFALITQYFLEKKIKLFLFLIFLLFIYVIYYFFIINLFEIKSQRLGSFGDDPLQVFVKIISIKNLIIHIFAFFDTSIGISHIIKLFYFLINNNILTIILSFFLAYIFLINIKSCKINKFYFKKILLLSLYTLLFSQLFLIITTKFINIPFGLGNRSNIYISIVVSILTLWILSKNFKYLNFSILFISFLLYFGNINYWSNVNQKTIFLKENILKLNEKYTDKKIIFKNIEFVKLYNFKHIELINYQYVLDSFIKSHELESNNYYYLLKDINISEFDKKSTFLLIDFENNFAKEEIKSKKKLIETYNSYRNFNEYRHWLQYIDLSKLISFLPQHYVDKFVLKKKVE